MLPRLRELRHSPTLQWRECSNPRSHQISRQPWRVQLLGQRHLERQWQTMIDRSRLPSSRASWTRSRQHRPGWRGSPRGKLLRRCFEASAAAVRPRRHRSTFSVTAGSSPTTSPRHRHGRPAPFPRTADRSPDIARAEARHAPSPTPPRHEFDGRCSGGSRVVIVAKTRSRHPRQDQPLTRALRRHVAFPTVSQVSIGSC
jgi:hypothetical protein